MNFTQLLIGYLLTIPVFFAIDMLWLGLIAKGFYNKQLSSLLADNVNWVSAIIFYLLFIVGIFIFATVPAVKANSYYYSLTYGALFGFFTYATYDLTNHATLKDWPLEIVFVDILWGSILTSLVATAGFFILKWV